MSTKIIQALVGMYSYYERELDDFSKDIFLAGFSGHSEDRIIEAIKKATIESKFLPKVATITDILGSSKPSEALKAREQWTEFYTQLRYHSSPKFDDPITAYIAQNVLNIWSLKQDSETAIQFAEKKFMTAYEDCSRPEVKRNIAIKCAGNKLLTKTSRDRIIAWIGDKPTHRDHPDQVKSDRIAKLATEHPQKSKRIGDLMESVTHRIDGHK